MIFCIVTVLVIFFSGCSAKGEEVFDTFLLVARNLIQFSRLAIVLRRSGRSIFTRIPAIDLSTAAEAGYTLDFDLEDEEAELEDRRAAGGDLSAIRAKRAAAYDVESLHASTSSLPGSRRISRTGTPVQGQSSAAQPFLLGPDDEDDDNFLNGSPKPTKS